MTAPLDDTDETVELCVHAIDYVEEDGEPTIYMFGRQESGEDETVRIRNYRPYFYVDARHDPQEITDTRNVTGTDPPSRTPPTIGGSQTRRVYTESPGDVTYARTDFDHHEADVPFVNRFIIDAAINSGVRVPDDRAPDDVLTISLPVAAPTQVLSEYIQPVDLSVPLRSCIFDIEVDDRTGFPTDGESTVISIAAHDGKHDAYTVWLYEPDEVKEQRRYIGTEEALDERFPDEEVNLLTFDEERKMLASFINYVDMRDFDALSGWSSNDFDVPYFIDRCEKKGVDAERLSRLDEIWSGYRKPNVKGRLLLDLYPAFENTQQRELDSYRLEDVGQAMLGRGKEEYDGNIGDLWSSNPADLLEYNLRDVELCVALDRQEHITEFWQEVSEFVGCQLPEAPYAGDVCDVYLLHRVRDEFVLPTRSNIEGSGIEGATVFEPASGRFDSVATLDLASLYPFSMVSINASPETLVDPDEYDGEMYRAPTGQHFRAEPDGIVREMVFTLLDERRERKADRDEYDPDDAMYGVYDRQQAAVKVIMNALYGVLTWSNFRLYDEEVGAAITSVGRSVLGRTQTIVQKEFDEKVLYGDTDSVLIHFPDRTTDEALDRALELEAAINDAYDEFAESNLGVPPGEHYFEIECETIYDTFFQAGKKKRYAGHVVWKEGKEVDDVTITGFEYVRSDTAQITKEVQHAVLERIVRNVPADEIAEFVGAALEEARRGDVPVADLGIPGGIGQELLEYDRLTTQVRGAMYSNMLLGTSFGKGSKPRRVHGETDQVAMTDTLTVDTRATDERQPKSTPMRTPDPDVLCYEGTPDIPPWFEVDYDGMARRTIKNPVKRVLDPLGVDWSVDVEGAGDDVSLSEFM